jgi:signal transduction histidine kinase
LGIILSFVAIGGGIYLKQYTDVKHQLKSQGAVLSANLAHNAGPFIVDYDKDQLNQFLSAMLENPLVLFSGIINTRYTDPVIDVLQKQSFVNLKFVTDVIREQKYGSIQAAYSIPVNHDQIKNVIYCIAPIMSDFKFPDDETTLLYGQPKHRGIIGYSVIAYRMPWEQLFSVQIHWVVGAFIVMAILLGTILGKLIANHFTGRIQRIYLAIQTYSFGDVIHFNDQKNDEITDISHALTGLTEMVAMQLNTMTQLNKELEHRISDRVAHIQALNQSIQTFSNNQRAFIGQTVQEIKSLIQILPLLEPNPTAYSHLMTHVKMFLERLLFMVKHNKEFPVLGIIEKVNVASVLVELMPLFDALVKRNNNQLTMDCDKALVMQTDVLQLKQSLIQLLFNASKYTHHGSIAIDISGDEKNIYIKIKDTGIGMDQEKVNRVLTQLDQNNMALMDAFSTLGLGLVLVHRFCRNIHAKLICMSQLNQGSTIEMIHPIQHQKSRQLNPLILCYCEDPKSVLNIKGAVQVIHGWDAMAWEDDDMVEQLQPYAILIDLASQGAPQKIAQAKELSVYSQLWLLNDGKIIDVAHLVMGNDPDQMIAAIRPLVAHHNALVNVQCKGLSKSLIRALENQGNIQCSSKYVFNEKVHLYIIHESRYRIKKGAESVVLMVDNAQSLNALIQREGWEIGAFLASKLSQ